MKGRIELTLHIGSETVELKVIDASGKIIGHFSLSILHALRLQSQLKKLLEEIDES